MNGVEAALESIPAGSAIHPFLRYEVGRSLVETGQPAKALPYLLSFWWWDEPEKVPREYWLGRAYEAFGRPERARHHYANFVNWWRDADSALVAWREEARERLGRLIESPSG